MTTSLYFWIGFHVFVALMLVLDLGLLHRNSRVMSMREALAWSAFWIGLAAAFAVFVYFWHGPRPALEFVTGYVIEQSMSVDNLFVFLVLFQYFRVPKEHQYKVLFWGIIGALVLRLTFVLVGVSILKRFEFVIYFFGALLIYSGYKLFSEEEREVHPEKNPVLKLFRRYFPVTDNYVEDKFFVYRNGERWATPLFLVLLVVETTDVIFAIDSIPAILAITRDAFIVYTSNVFAILGLRSLYFALSGLITLFHYLNYGLAVILVFVGAKMLASHFIDIPVAITLGVIAAVLAISIGASLIWPQKKSVIETE
ncbi:MAG TPA: TerC family protein [Terriglobales bacterium]